MSALGQKWTCAVQKVMSALPPKADIIGDQVPLQQMAKFESEFAIHRS